MYIDIVGYDGGDETGFVFQISPDKLSMVYKSDGYYETEEALDDARAVIDVKQDRTCLEVAPQNSRLVFRHGDAVGVTLGLLT